MSNNKTALIVGATGLVGGLVLDLLLDDNDFSEIIVLTRRTTKKTNSKLKEIIIDYDALEKYSNDIKADVVFSCLGTTIKAAGSQEAFKKVDFEYPKKIAEIAKANGATKFLLVSALGASKSSIVFYNRVKGETEEAISNIGFDVLHILQPSLIIGERTEARLGEGIAQKLSPLFNTLMVGPLDKYKSIEAIQIAKAMVNYSKQNAKGIFRHENHELRKVAG